MYTMMKPSSTMSGDMCNTSDGSIGSMGPGPGPGGPNGGPGGSGPGPGGSGPGGNGNGSGSSGGIIGNSGDNMEMKNSPANGPGTPRDDSSGNMGDFGMTNFGGPPGNGGPGDANESEAILKIKESMQEEAKRFEKDSDHPDYFMQ